jgi:signal transduction histidine kinase
MNSDTKAQLCRDFQRYLRLITLAVVILTALTQVMVQPQWSPVLTASHVWCSDGLLVAFALWTCLVPTHRLSPSLRLCALLFEVILVLGASLLGAPRLYYFVYMCIIAKAALQLELKGLVLVMLAAVCAHVGSSEAVGGAYYHYMQSTNRVPFPGRSSPLLHAEMHLYFVFAMVTVAAMMRAMVAERENRLRAEKLSDEVEEMVLRFERARISRDIHDALGHTLTSLNIQLDVAKTMFEKNGQKAMNALVAAKELAAQSLADVRRSVHMIREEDGSPYDLKGAVTTLVSRARRNNLVVELQLDQPVLPLFKAHNLFCIIQESLTNAQRHAHARTVRIELKEEADKLVLHIVDDGDGFDGASQMPGLGIQSMKERAELLGGTFEIESTLGSGTQINVCIPIGVPVAT